MLKTAADFVTLSDDQLLAETRRLVATERQATVALLQSLMELDARRLYLREGCSSLFTYCTQVLHLAEGAAYNRIEAARVARRHPPVLEALAAGSITLTTARLLAPHLTDSNHQSLLEAAHHKSKREVELLIATLHPKPAAPTVLRRVSVGDQPMALTVPPGGAQDVITGPPPITPRTGDVVPFATSGTAAETGAVGRSNESQGSQDRDRPNLAPLSATNYRLQVTIRCETHDKLRLAQDLLRHAIPTGDVAEILDRALTLLVADLERRRCAAAIRPRNAYTAAAPGKRHIPASVRRAVWRRDQGRCAFIGSGGRCRETSFVEFHHVEPYATGGVATVENIQLRCRAHNLYEALLFFGEGSECIRECGAEWSTRDVSSFRNESERAGLMGTSWRALKR